MLQEKVGAEGGLKEAVSVKCYVSLQQRSTHYTHQPHNKQLFRRTADTAALGVKSKSITSQKTTVISAVVARRDKAEEAGSSLRGDLVVIEWH